MQECPSQYFSISTTSQQGLFAASSSYFAYVKAALCSGIKRNLYTAKWGQPFGIWCDASRTAVGSQLVQWNAEGEKIPISFASLKLFGAQLSWAAVEKKAYAVI